MLIKTHLLIAIPVQEMVMEGKCMLKTTFMQVAKTNRI